MEPQRRRRRGDELHGDEIHGRQPRGRQDPRCAGRGVVSLPSRCSNPGRTRWCWQRPWRRTGSGGGTGGASGGEGGTDPQQGEDSAGKDRAAAREDRAGEGQCGSRGGTGSWLWGRSGRWEKDSAAVAGGGVAPAVRKDRVVPTTGKDRAAPAPRGGIGRRRSRR